MSDGNDNPPLVIERIFDAPVERVWQAWTQSEQMMKWWGPKDFTAPTVEIDFRVGGKYLYCMRGAMAEGMPEQDFWNTGEYVEIVPNQKLVMTDNFSDKDGNVIPASTYGLPGDWPDRIVVTVTFEDVDGKTKLTLRHEGIPAGEMGENTKAGWNQSFDKLVESLGA